MYPIGMLKNIATGRFHPIVFRLAPMPGNSDAGAAAQRYKSFGHHTVGFDTEDEAMTHIKGQPQYIWTGRAWEWDGAEVPAMVEWFAFNELVQS